MKILVINSFNPGVFETFFPAEVIEQLNLFGDVDYVDYNKDESSKELLFKKIEDADVVFTGWNAPQFDDTLLSHAKKLRLIAHTGGSAYNLLSDALYQRPDITLLSGNPIYAQSVAEAAICFMLMGQRRIIRQLTSIQTPQWKPPYKRTDGLRHKTVGLVGFGMIAKNVALLLHPFGVKIKVWAEYTISDTDKEYYQVEQCSLDELCLTSDIISLHAGMSERNYHLINQSNLSLMRDDTLIVNTARGSLINEAELEDELISGRLRAVLDVFEQEPLPMTSRLRGLENVILIPHTGGPTQDMRVHTTLALIEDLKKYLAGDNDLLTKLPLSYAVHMTDHRILSSHNKQTPERKE